MFNIQTKFFLNIYMHVFILLNTCTQCTHIYVTLEHKTSYKVFKNIEIYASSKS